MPPTSTTIAPDKINPLEVKKATSWTYHPPQRPLSETVYFPERSPENIELVGKVIKNYLKL